MTLLLNNGDDQDPQIDPNLDYLSELVGPGKKYANEKELAKAYFHADKTLAVTTRRMDQMRSDYDKEREQNLTRAQLEDVLTRFGRTPLASSELPLANEDTNVKPSTIDPDQIKGLISDEYKALRERERQEANEASVKAKLTERFGPNFNSVLSKHAVDLGLSDVDVNHMARTNPKLFTRTFGLDQPARKDGLETPMRNSQSFLPTSGPDRTWSYYQKLKTDDPKKYYSPKMQNQMLMDYDRLGDKFEDGNFDQF